jgi:hypothetical protein
MTGNIVELIDNETIIDYFGRADNYVDVDDAIEEYLRTQLPTSVPTKDLMMQLTL